MKLSEYLEKKGIYYRDFAKALGLDHTTVHKYASGSRSPSLETAVKIEKETKGKVTVESWAKNGKNKS